MDEVKGYKAFNQDATNRYGMPFLKGETYRVEGTVVFGNNGNGYHMCSSLSDVFRYVNAREEDVLVALVTGRGKRAKMNDEYYGYYDMYSFEEITIERFLSREEVIERMLKASPFEIMKFLMTCRLAEEEKDQFAQAFRSNIEVMNCLLYYQYGCKDIYENKNGSSEDIVRLVLRDGQNNNKGSKRE